METPACPKCRSIIPAEDVNVATDVAFCRRCNLASPLSGMAHGTRIDPDVDVHRPPPGAWHRVSGLGTIIGATHRSLGAAAITFGLAAFWNGITSVFVLLAVAATLYNAGIDVPEWFPKPVMNGDIMSVGMTIFLWLFLTPFIVIGLVMIGVFLSCLFGRTEVRVTAGQGVLIKGIGAVATKRRFSPDAVKDVRLEEVPWKGGEHRHRNHKPNHHIIIELADGKPLKLGSALSEERRQFMAAALRNVLVRPGNNRFFG